MDDGSPGRDYEPFVQHECWHPVGRAEFLRATSFLFGLYNKMGYASLKEIKNDTR